MDEKGPQNTFKITEPFDRVTKLKYGSDDMHSYVANVIQISEENYEQIESNYKRIVDEYLSTKKQLRSSLANRNKELKGMDILKRNFDYGIASMGESQLNFYEQLFRCLLEYDVNNLLFMISKPSIITSARLSNLFYFVNEKQICSAFFLKYILSKYIEIEASEQVYRALINKNINIEELLREMKSDMENIISKNKDNLRMSNQIEQYRNVVLLINYIFDNRVVLEEPKMDLEFDWNKVSWTIDLWITEQRILNKELKYRLFLDEGIPEEPFTTIQKMEVESHCDSKEYIGLQITDMIVVLVGKLTSQMSNSVRYDFNNPEKQTFLDEKYFDFNKGQYELINLMNRFLLDKNTNYHFNTDCYFDDSVRIQSYLGYICSYKDFNKFKNTSLEEHTRNHFLYFVEIANNKFNHYLKNEEQINENFVNFKIAVEKGIVRPL